MTRKKIHTYRILRFNQDPKESTQTILTGLSEQAAKKYCSDPNTAGQPICRNRLCISFEKELEDFSLLRTGTAGKISTSVAYCPNCGQVATPDWFDAYSVEK